MNNQFPQLNLESFAHGYQSFYKSTIGLLKHAEQHRTLHYILPKSINSQYAYSDAKRKGHSTMSFLEQTYLVEEQEIFLSFFNEMLPNIIKYQNMEDWRIRSIDKYLGSVVKEFAKLIVESNNSDVFKIDFYYDKINKDFRRKIDSVTSESINSNNNDLDGDNKNRYQQCVSDFLSYKRDLITGKKLFYNDSLNNLKKVIENALQNDYKKEDGSSPRLHNKKELSNILFDSSNSDFESRIDYIIKNIHHEEGGQPKIFTEKEYIYLWLELNNILYLLNRYKK
jgi:hypothetical protein